MRLVNNSFHTNRINTANKQMQIKENQSNITFGYDIQANEKLYEEAENIGLNPIISLQNECNSAENKIRFFEYQEGGAGKALEDTWKVLIPLKVALVQLVKRNLPESDFADQEIKHYIEEAKREKADEYKKQAIWRAVLALAISDAKLPDNPFFEMIDEDTEIDFDDSNSEDILKTAGWN